MKTYEIIIVMKNGISTGQLILTPNKLLAYQWLKEQAASILGWTVEDVEDSFEHITKDEAMVYDSINRALENQGWEFIWFTEIGPQK